MSTADRYAEWDAAYVLGALPPAQRHEYEEHLAGCAECRGAVAELAAMPGLLARVPIAEALELSTPGPGHPVAAPPPEPQKPDRQAHDPQAHDRQARDPQAPDASAAPTAVRRLLRRPVPRRGLALAAAALVLVVGVGLGFALRGVTPAPSADRLAFAAVTPSSITAVVDVVPVAAGTDINVECQYGDLDPTDEHDTRYAIWVVDRSGHGTEIKPWTVRPNKVMHPSGRTDLHRTQLAAVEIRAVESGATVLRATL